MSATVGSRGQITIPKRVRDIFGIVPGSKIDIQRAPNGQIVLVISGKRVPGRFAKLLGCAGKGMSTDEIMTLTRGEP